MSDIKPPLGLTPRWIKDQHRIREILRAMDRYNDVTMPIPEEWVDELNDLVWQQREDIVARGKTTGELMGEAGQP